LKKTYLIIVGIILTILLGTILYFTLKPKENNLKAQDIPIDILYEDDDIIVVNKPKGLVVHPANRKF